MKHLKAFKIFESNSTDRTRDHWIITRRDSRDMPWYKVRVNLGDKVLEDGSERMHPLPGSQATPDDGLYTLKYISIDKTEIVIKGRDNRKAFDFDNYDGTHTSTLDYMVEHFDELPPIIFYEKRDGTYEHIDGHHRVVAAKELGRTEILAFIKELNQTGDYVNEKPKPVEFKVKDYNELNSADDNRWLFRYKGKLISKPEALKVSRTGDVVMISKK